MTLKNAFEVLTLDSNSCNVTKRLKASNALLVVVSEAEYMR